MRVLNSLFYKFPFPLHLLLYLDSPNTMIMAAMKRTILILVTLSAAAAQMPSWGLEKTRPMEAVINSICPDCAPMTPQILKTFLEPNAINIGRNSYITRQGTTLRLNGEKWTASGANVYWLGLDENVIPPAGEPFYAPLNASYPTKARITEIMNVMTMMGIRLIRSQTLGISVGNPLSIMPSLGVYNEAAFDPIDWSVFQARQHGLRIVVPLIDNHRTTTMGANITSSDGAVLM
jgi:mannan endo-1,4-beta-mannosidase